LFYQKNTKNPVKNYLSFFKKNFFIPVSSPQTDPKGRIVVNGYLIELYMTKIVLHGSIKTNLLGVLYWAFSILLRARLPRGSDSPLPLITLTTQDEPHESY
jgi:hypothetical protein